MELKKKCNYEKRFKLTLYDLTWNGEASSERVSSMAMATSTNRAVIDNFTVSVQATRAWTWIHAFLVHATQVWWTF